METILTVCATHLWTLQNARYNSSHQTLPWAELLDKKRSQFLQKLRSILPCAAMQRNSLTSSCLMCT
jgi:hypothetical protein